MNVRQLQSECEQAGIDPENMEVRIASQPSYPMQNYLRAVVAVDLKAPSDDEEDDVSDECDCGALPGEPHRHDCAPKQQEEQEWVVFLGEGGSPDDSPYLPSAAARALWR